MSREGTSQQHRGGGIVVGKYIMMIPVPPRRGEEPGKMKVSRVNPPLPPDTGTRPPGHPSSNNFLFYYFNLLLTIVVRPNDLNSDQTSPTPRRCVEQGQSLIICNRKMLTSYKDHE